MAVFEFLSDSTARQDRNKKVELYLNEIGVQEYFIHQPELKRPAELRGWQRGPSRDIVEMEMEADGSIISRALNLQLRYEEQPHTDVRLLRPYLPDGTPITTSLEEQHLKEAAEARIEEEEVQRRQELEAEIKRLRT